MRSAVSRYKFFMIADNNVGDSDSSWEERTDEGPINPIEEAKRLGANLATAEKKNTDESGRENRNKTNFKWNQVKKKNQLFVNFKNKIATF